MNTTKDTITQAVTENQAILDAIAVLLDEIRLQGAVLKEEIRLQNASLKELFAEAQQQHDQVNLVLERISLLLDRK